MGGAFGLLAGGPVGAALGALAGHILDEQADSRADAALRDDTQQPADGSAGASRAEISERFFRTTFEVMGHVAKADGRVSPQEIAAARAVMNSFRLDATQVEAAIACFNRGKDPNFGLEGSLLALRRACASHPQLLVEFLEIQLQVAIGASDLRGAARPLMQRIAAMLGVNGLEFAHLEALTRMRLGLMGSPGMGSNAGAGSGRSYGGGSQRSGGGSARGAVQGMQEADAYKVLEIDAGASDGDVVKAYRRQLSRHHPDKLKANGLPESMLENAKQRTQQIIEAWDLIRQRRGLS
jgi:DnaJ like chaperone protein